MSPTFSLDHFVPFGGFGDDGMTPDSYNSEQCPFVKDELGDDVWCDAVSSQVVTDAVLDPIMTTPTVALAGQADAILRQSGGRTPGKQCRE